MSLKTIIGPMRKVMACLQKNCKKEIQKTMELRTKAIEPIMAMLEKAKKDHLEGKITEQQYIKIVKTVSKKLLETYDKLDKSQEVLSMYVCSATKCQKEHIQNLKSLLRFQETSCKKGQKKMCEMAKHTSAILKNNSITSEQLQSYTKKERMLYS